MIINFYGGPNSGKSLYALTICRELKKRHYRVDLVQEWIKGWAYAGRKCRSFDQVYVFGRQLHREDYLLQHGCQHIVTDSPMLLQCVYTHLAKAPFADQLLNIALLWEKTHDHLHIYLERAHQHYDRHGRYETPSEAAQVDSFMLDYLKDHLGDKLLCFKSDDEAGIVSCVLSAHSKEAK